MIYTIRVMARDNLVYNNKLILIKNKCYSLLQKDSKVTNAIYSFTTENGQNMWVTDSTTYFYIWDFFINPSEWREQQLNSILDE